MLMSTALETVLAAPGPSEIDTEAIVALIAAKIAPILVAGLGLVLLGRAGKGQVSAVLTTTAIAIIGLFFIAGAGVLFFFGESLVDLTFK